jgi:23S rRNA (adenine1618-N6)-methyltransferase
MKTPEKTDLHARNPHRFRYDFEELTSAYPGLRQFVTLRHGNETIDFSDPDAVKALNKALLLTDYNISDWDIPTGYLCPPIPGRADYIHYLADILAEANNGIVPEGDAVLGLDIGTGANCIYPIIGNAAYGWNFVGTDVDERALENCSEIIRKNPHLIESISLQLQTEPRFIFKNIITPEDRFTFTICNPPFHASHEEAIKANIRKTANISQSKVAKPVLNFGGQNSELWFKGGEFAFITQMVHESVKYPMQCLWFTVLVSKKDNLKGIYRILNKVNASEIKTIEMVQGQKTSRFIAWTFQTKAQQKSWKF